MEQGDLVVDPAVVTDGAGADPALADPVWIPTEAHGVDVHEEVPLELVEVRAR